jgi:hypothetical protein
MLCIKIKLAYEPQKWVRDLGEWLGEMLMLCSVASGLEMKSCFTSEAESVQHSNFDTNIRAQIARNYFRAFQLVSQFFMRGSELFAGLLFERAS